MERGVKRGERVVETGSIRIICRDKGWDISLVWSSVWCPSDKCQYIAQRADKTSQKKNAKTRQIDCKPVHWNTEKLANEYSTIKEGKRQHQLGNRRVNLLINNLHADVF